MDRPESAETSASTHQQTSASFLPLVLYLGSKQLSPHSPIKKRWLQFCLIFSDLFRWWIPQLPLVIRIIYSYFISHTPNFRKDICYTKKGYETKPRHYMDIYPQTKGAAPVIVFVHGGAWGFSSKFDHHLVGKKLQQLGFVVVIPSYSRFPFGHIEDMIDDIDQVFDWVTNNVSGWGGHHHKIILFGHSAGAHIILMTVLEKILRAHHRTLFKVLTPKPTAWKLSNFKHVVLCSGVYDIVNHFDFEAQRSVEDISPMKPAMRDFENFPQYSPTLILQHLVQTNEVEILKSITDSLPPVHIYHADPDLTVPASSSQALFKALTDIGVTNGFLKLIEGIRHADFVLELMRKDEGVATEGPIRQLFQTYYTELAT